MHFSIQLPSISVQEVFRKRKSQEKFLFLDVREPFEKEIVNLGAAVEYLPLSKIQGKQLAAIPPALQDKKQEVIVFCHHGGRSAQVTQWLMSHGWENVKNMVGGIDAYALEIDTALPRY